MPPGYTSVPVKIDDDGVIYQARMVAGSVATRMESSGVAGERGPGGRRGRPRPKDEPLEVGLDTLAVVSGWWIFLVDEGRETEWEKIERFRAGRGAGAGASAGEVGEAGRTSPVRDG